MRTIALICMSVAVCAFSVRGGEFSGYRVVSRSQPSRIEAFDNGGFENRVKFGRIKGYDAEIGAGYGYNGNAGMRFWVHGKKMDQGQSITLPTDIKLKPNHKYRFSCDTHPHGKVFSSCGVEFYRNNKYAGSDGACAFTDLGGGWRHCEVEFCAKVAGPDVRTRFYVYLSSKTSDPAQMASDENYVEVDNLELVEAIPDWVFVNTWPSYNDLYAETGRLRALSAPEPGYAADDADLAYVLRLADSQGRELGRHTVTADAHGVLEATFGPLAHRGDATLAVTMYDRKHRLNLGTRTRTLHVKPQPTDYRVNFTEDGRTVVRGKPTMLLGFFTDFACFKKRPKETLPGELKKLRDAGFNTLVEYSVWEIRNNRKDLEYFFEECKKAGIFVVDGAASVNDWKPDKPQLTRERVVKFSAFEPIVGWWGADEVNIDRYPALEKIRDITNASTPGIPMWTCNLFAPERVLLHSDVFGGGAYPIGKAGDLRYADRNFAKYAAMRPAAQWMDAQIYNWNGKKHDFSKEEYLKGEGTENQVLAVAVLEASHGATGFFFYSYFDIYRSPYPELPAKRWAIMKNVAKQMKDLEPFIMSGKGCVEIAHKDVKGKSRVVALSDGKGNRRVLVIGLDKDNVCEIDAAEFNGAKFSSCYGLTQTEKGKSVFTGGPISCDILQNAATSSKSPYQ